MGSELGRPTALGAAALALALAIGTSCSSPPSFVILGLELASTAPGPITGVGAVRVHVSQGTTPIKNLTFTVKAPASGLVIDAYVPSGDSGAPADGGDDADAAAGGSDGGMVKTLSVDFSSGVTGTVSFDVDTLDKSDCIIGQGHADVVIRKGAVAEGTVALTPQPPHDCGANLDGGSPDGNSPDGGSPDGNSPDGGPSDGGPTFPGCDPMSPQTGAGLQCAANQVCQVDCPLGKTDCVQGGSGAPGSLCTSNASCAPGSQCFDYSSLGCKDTKICLRFCGGTSDCAAFGAGGGGSGSLCEGPVQCGPTRTSYHTCTFNCDPTAAAAATHGGCPDKLVCVMPASMDAVDCACPETTRIKTEGQTCTAAADCAPGLICNQMNGTKICRPICRCQAVNGACTAGAGTCPTANTTCHLVANDTLFGVCY